MSDNFLDEVCNKHFSTQSALNKHLKSPSHLKQLKLNELKENNEGVNEEDLKKQLKKEVTKNFYCPLCDFQTKNQFDFDNHGATLRHTDNLVVYKLNVKKIPDMYNNFFNDYYKKKIFIGIVKGKEITKNDIIEKYKVKIIDSLQNYTGYNERMKYGEKDTTEKDTTEEKKNNQEAIKQLENTIISLEKKQKKYLNQIKKYNMYISDPEKNEVASNPAVLKGFIIHKKKYLEIDSLKDKLQKLKH